MKIYLEKIGHASLTCAKGEGLDLSAYGISKNTPKDKVFYVYEVAIYEQYRRKGNVNRLLELIKTFSKDNSCIICLDAIPLDSSMPPDKLRNVYLRNGFTAFGGTAFIFGTKYVTYDT